MNTNEFFSYPLCRGPTLKLAEFEVDRVVHKTLKNTVWFGVLAGIEVKF